MAKFPFHPDATEIICVSRVQYTVTVEASYGFDGYVNFSVMMQVAIRAY